ncbi:DUF397 domain-containing protein [Streptomyces spectabilis]|uniref:DUF397 domain-containing protein n=1 Tax=Streptomyces spectabilis TaxID=68270 RepID=A0A5P2X7Z7_STRST|nr:DUF397 domain-containing protein [Streptomyces spectabilis]MCI3903962.1 DUF397 domain-containing protein [Streptomyces spectabilis]QEV61117.1 DUF397 domain-containing protein [Streptomyces spectabilis]GGV18706.1 toxin [Streptomyces spectabilis]
MGYQDLTNARWRRSSYSGNTGGECVECAPLDGAAWRKSSHSGSTGGDCLEVTELPGPHIAIRDSKRPAGPHLTVSAAAFTALVSTL